MLCTKSGENQAKVAQEMKPQPADADDNIRLLISHSVYVRQVRVPVYV